MIRAQAIDKGLVIASNDDYARNECLRKVPYAVLTDALVEAYRLAARSSQDGKRLRVYCCRFCGKMHIGNYSPSRRTPAGQIASLQAENKTALGKISILTNELTQCRTSRDRLRSELGQVTAALAKKTLWRRLLSWAWRKAERRRAGEERKP